ncbi:phospholipase D-like domain-containing protein [Bacteroides intestinalis]|jgi:phosphatidylserine/phosphatidylglycerophosphate/cardiolipin synthase-like enzyme|uniref:phospholipase D-like domain-containing protein n=1 Tax=Bacteroides intestinalis TaxID=329854 RepID=UPI0022E71C4F|nr:phospholipase D-like domain-containing protein [Bacteroides intestinalis]
MKISELSIQELYVLVDGDNPCSIYRKGKELVFLFNKYGGYREVYDDEGLPSIGKKNGQRPSRKEFTIHHMRELNGKTELRTILETVINESPNPQVCSDEIRKIIVNDGYSLSERNGVYNIIGGIKNNNNIIINDAKFNRIQQDILAALNNAKVSVLVAVAWITNNTLISKLQELHNSGVDVKILLTEDYTNHRYFPDTNMNVFEKRGKGGGKMHHKFCVIDNQVVLHGSYNWSTNAEMKNDEDITVTLGDLELATKYSLRFRELLKDSVPFEK